MKLIEINPTEFLLAQMADIPHENKRKIAATEKNRELILEAGNIMKENGFPLCEGTAKRFADRITEHLELVEV